MAKMWPLQIPVWISQDKRRSAEIRVFNQLEKELDNSWSVFYSRPWYGISQSGGEIEGEADFIVAHPDFGILFIEVKGGQISYEPSRAQWFSIDRSEIKHKIKDPVEQAKKCRYEFAKKLEKQSNWPSHYINYKYGVVLTDTSEPSLDINTIGSHEKFLFCHSSEFENDFESWILGRLSKHGREKELVGPGTAGIEIIDSLIAQPVNLTVTLGTKIREEVELMDSLFTGAQLQVVHSINSKRRVVVSGGAGTGKTVLAVEIASLHSKFSNRVLLLTCSSTLATHLSRKLSSNENITIATVDEFHISKNALIKWDVVIVDEGQDVEWAKWEDIENICNPTTGKLIVFMDSNQSIYRIPADITTLLGAESFSLNINLRNTRNIARSTESLYTGPLIYAPGPEGDLPSIIHTSSFDAAIKESISLVKRLTSIEAVKRNEITFLCRDKETRQKIIYELARNQILAVNASEIRADVSCVETVPLFKGLESTIVIAICDAAWANNQEMAYVSVSRARSRLFLVGNTSGTLIEKALKGSEATSVA